MAQWFYVCGSAGRADERIFRKQSKALVKKLLAQYRWADFVRWADFLVLFLKRREVQKSTCFFSYALVPTLESPNPKFRSEN
jgi:hypothetical protein